MITAGTVLNQCRIQTLELIMLVQRFGVLIRRRKGERLFPLDWNPLARKLEQAPCEYSYTWEHPREVCDDALHLIKPAAHGPCAHCGNGLLPSLSSAEMSQVWQEKQLGLRTALPGGYAA